MLNQSAPDFLIRGGLMGVKRYELNDAQWERIASLLPGKAGDPGRTAGDDRLFVNGVLWVLRSGAHWQDLPERCGKWKSLHKRFTRWAKAGVWEKVFAQLIKDRDNTYLMLDTTLVRVHQQAAAGKGGPGSGSGPFPRRTDDQDGLRRSLRILLTPGHRHDNLTAKTLLEGFKAEAVIADRAYDNNDLRAFVADGGARTVIASTRSRKAPIPYEKTVYRERNRIERCFNPPQPFPPLRDPLRPKAYLLSRFHPSRRNHPMDAMNVDSS
jgi:transposase